MKPSRRPTATNRPLIVALLSGMLASITTLATPLLGAAPGREMVIHAGTLIDGVSAMPRREMSILIRDDRIVGVEPGYVAPAGMEVVDLSKSTVMPGFID